MTTSTNQSSKRPAVSFWRKRATFEIGKTRRQRQEQYRQQINILLITLLVASVVGGLFSYFNYLGAGSAKTVSCIDFPRFCVPLVGGAPGEGEAAKSESAEVRELDGESRAAPGVVRGITPDKMGFIGNPDAPVHFAVVSDFACSHCQDFHESDLRQFVDDFVLTGQATLQLVMVTGTGQQYSETASQAVLCAGEQGAFWEMQDEMYRLANSMSVVTAFQLDYLRDTAEDMGLDGDTLAECVGSGRYLPTLADYRTFATDNGVTGTPTMLVSYGDSGQWSKIQRDYNTLKATVEAANPQ